MLSARDWRQADYWLFATLFMPSQDKPDDRILLLELPDVGANDPSSKEFRQLLGRTLKELALRRPKQVAVDLAVMAGGDALPAVVEGVNALLDAHIPLYFAIHPNIAPDELAREVYGASRLAGIGHTELRLGQGLAFFRSVAVQPYTAKEFAYLPALLAGVDAWTLPEYQVFSVPKDSSRLLGVQLDQVQAPLREMNVIVASSERECRQNRMGEAQGTVCAAAASARVWTGPELLVWSLSDLLQGRASKMRQPVNNPMWVLVAALCTAGVSFVFYLLGMRLAGRLLSPTRLIQRLWVLNLSTLLITLLLVAGGEWLLVQLGWILPPAFPLIAGLITIGICHMHSRNDLAEILTAITRRATDNALKAEVDVFISYSHAPENAAWVEREIVEPLRSMTLTNGRKLRLFFDKSNITIGQDWFSRINLSILGSRSFLCVWSEDYLERDYCRWELDYAFPRAARHDFLFLPVAHLSNNAQPDAAYAQYLQARQYVDASSREDWIEEIKTALRGHLEADRA